MLARLSRGFLCSCYQEKLKPFEGSSPIGNSCAESTHTDFLCCALAYGGCTCYYPCEGATDCAEVDEAQCGDSAKVVNSCPPK